MNRVPPTPGNSLKTIVRLFLVAAVLGTLSPRAAAHDDPPSLDQGFHLLYNLDFAGAEKQFHAWQSQHPEDAIGPAAEGAGLLFAEFDRMGILEGQFFADDSSFKEKNKLSPDPQIHARLDSALGRSEELARRRLAGSPQDADALLAMTMVYGLRADYAALIEKHNLASLRFSREASGWAEKLLAIQPDNSDAYLATGVHNYIIGSLAAPWRWILKLGGYSGDKQKGMADVERAAQHGRYLAPFGRILLAIAYVRDKDVARAREMLVSLNRDFPRNPLFPREIARLDSQSHGSDHAR
ncbi:MAG TPA: hypothetical protein VGQ94_05695 [Terriglobales bacterium]|nr:hypothetical protein [Terriglobales bacterium]